MPGLGLLPMHTVMNREKTTKQVRFGLNGSGSCDMEGLRDTQRAHRGRQRQQHKAALHTAGRHARRMHRSERCMGTYIHGILDNSGFVDFLLKSLHTGGTLKERKRTTGRSLKTNNNDKLAELIRRNVDMKLVYEILQNDNDD